VKTLLALAALLVLFSPVLANDSHELRSPDNRIVVTVRVGDEISYDVSVNGNVLLSGPVVPNRIGLSVTNLIFWLPSGILKSRI